MVILTGGHLEDEKTCNKVVFILKLGKPVFETEHMICSYPACLICQCKGRTQIAIKTL